MAEIGNSRQTTFPCCQGYPSCLISLHADSKAQTRLIRTLGRLNLRPHWRCQYGRDYCLMVLNVGPGSFHGRMDDNRLDIAVVDKMTRQAVKELSA